MTLDWPSRETLGASWRNPRTKYGEISNGCGEEQLSRASVRLANSPDWRPSQGFPFTREEIEAEAARWPDDWNDGSTLADGYGIAILRGGEGNDKRAFWLRYGRARSHTQDDLMDIGLQAFQGVILAHMGYPRNWGQWEPLWSSHNLARQFPYEQQVARAELFGDAGLVHVAEARAHAHANFNDDGTRS